MCLKEQPLFSVLFHCCLDYVITKHVMPWYFQSTLLHMAKEHIEPIDQAKVMLRIELPEYLDKEQDMLSPKEEQQKQEQQMLIFEDEGEEQDQQIVSNNQESNTLLPDKKQRKSRMNSGLTINTQNDGKRRHNSISYGFNHYASLSALPMLSPNTSTSTQSSAFSFCSPDSAQSRVEEIIYRFEAGVHHTPHRRYSVDSFHLNSKNKPLIPLRKFEFEPTKDQWRKRDKSDFSVSLRPSHSTPTNTLFQSYPNKRIMSPIPEKTKSMWV